MCISKASGPIHEMNVVTPNLHVVTISYAFEICIGFFQLAARFPFVSNFYGSDTLALNLVNDRVVPGAATASASSASTASGTFAGSKQ